MRKIKTALNKPFIWAGLALIVSACSTTSAPRDLGVLTHTGFSEKADGVAYHKVMGLSCPAAIKGMSRTSTQVYNDSGTDVSCNYAEGSRDFTLYLSEYPGDNLSRNFGLAKNAVDQRFSPQGYKFDEDLSETCSSSSLDEAAILSGLSGILSGANTTNEINLTTFPSAVFTQGDRMTLVIVDEMFEKEFFKVRYTGPYVEESSVEETCNLTRDTYLSLQQAIKVERGIPISDDDKLLNLINAPEDK